MHATGFLIIKVFLVQNYFKNCSVLKSCMCFLLEIKGSDQLSTVDSSLSLSHGACAAPEEPISATFHLEEEEEEEEEEGGVKQDFCQGENQEQTK